MSDTQKSTQAQTWVAFAMGFRLFFLGAAGLAGLSIAYWGVRFFEELPYLSIQYYPTVTWHMHEMVFGYIGAVVAGFLLTAVSNWTGLRTLRGWPLAMLVLIWLSARCLPFLGDDSGWLTALLNVMFFIYLAAAIAIMASGCI
jgi:uncharacterized protein involved in response to NO